VRAITISLIACVLLFLSGCQNGAQQRTLIDQVQRLTDEKMQLQKQLDQTNSEKELLEQQVKVLSGLPAEVKGTSIYDLQSVKITKYTNLYDKNEDGKKEKLIVYIQPMDQDGDIIKAAGSVEVELWDLNKPGQEALLGKWSTGPAELHKLWFTSFMRINYRLTLDVAEKAQQCKEPLTVKVHFTDYLTGKVFKEQAVIRP